MLRTHVFVGGTKGHALPLKEVGGAFESEGGSGVSGVADKLPSPLAPGKGGTNEHGHFRMTFRKLRCTRQELRTSVQGNSTMGLHCGLVNRVEDVRSRVFACTLLEQGSRRTNIFKKAPRATQSS